MFLNILLASFLTLVELNCENLFDFTHDEGKEDTEFVPDGIRRWTPRRYWNKVNNIARDILSCGFTPDDDTLPDLVALCEVENDSVMRDLTKRSLLRNAGYEYIMTDSPDRRGIDVALLYSPFSFAPVSHRSIRPEPVKHMGPTRDILYVSGRIITGDTLHIFIVHAPSRYGGERFSRPFRMAVAGTVLAAVDSIRALSPNAGIVVAGDFNAYTSDRSIALLTAGGLTDVTSGAKGGRGVAGTYRYNGRWGSIDHVFVCGSLLSRFESSRVGDASFLIEEDDVYGGVRPRRSFAGRRYQKDGVSDHLPLIVRFRQ